MLERLKYTARAAIDEWRNGESRRAHLALHGPSPGLSAATMVTDQEWAERRLKADALIAEAMDALGESRVLVEPFLRHQALHGRKASLIGARSFFTSVATLSELHQGALVGLLCRMNPNAITTEAGAKWAKDHRAFVAKLANEGGLPWSGGQLPPETTP